MADVSSIYEAIKAKYTFSIPAEYRSMEATGWFSVQHPGESFKPENEPTHLWIPEMEWLRPQEILDYEPEAYHKSGFVPFAFNGAGDHFGWWPSLHPTAVVLCPHDDELAAFQAPNFVGAIYRQCLEYATGFDRGEESSVRRQFADWAQRLSAYLPPLFVETLQAVGKGELIPAGTAIDDKAAAASEAKQMKRLNDLKQMYSSEELTFLQSELAKYRASLLSGARNHVQLLTPERCEELIERDLTFARLNEEFKWMNH
jgi:hypothetical protein